MSTSNTCVKISIKQFGEFCRTCLTKISPPATPVFIYGTVIDNIPLTELLYKCVNIKATEEDKLPPNMCTQCVFNLGQFNSFYRQCQKSQQTLQSVLNLEEIIKKNTAPLKFRTYSKSVDEQIPNKTSSKSTSKPVFITKRTLQRVSKPELSPIQFIHSYCKPPTDEKSMTNPPPLLMFKKESGRDNSTPPAPTEEISITTENSHSNAPPLLILTPEMKKTVFQHKRQMLLSEESLKLENTSKIDATDIFNEEMFEELVSFEDLYANNIFEHQPVPQREDGAMKNVSKNARELPKTPKRVKETSNNKLKVVKKRRLSLLYAPLAVTDSDEPKEESEDPTPDNTTDPLADNTTYPTPDNTTYSLADNTTDTLADNAIYPFADNAIDPLADNTTDPLADNAIDPLADNAIDPTPDNPPPTADVEPKPPIKRQYQCAECGLVFKGYHQYKTHTYSHKGGQMPHVCKHCGKDFLLKSLLKKHYYSHTNEKTILCTFCSKFFKTPALLRLHIRKVHFKKPEDDLIDAKCPKCDQHFTSKSKYRMHQKVHSTRRHLCSECGKIFKVKTLFIHHMRLHTGETPFKCTVCEKGFRNNFALKHHVYSHTGEKPYECDVCQRKFRRPAHLRTHKKTHVTIKCCFCEKSLPTVASWKKHVSTHDYKDEGNSDFETNC